MTLTTTDLRKICDAATPGEWEARPVALKADAYTIATNEKHVLYAVTGEVKCGRAGDYYECHNLQQPEALVRIRTEDASFIKVFQPTRVRAMLDEIDALKAELKTALKRSAEYAREAGEWKGRYEAAGYPGTLDGWISRAEAAEALVKEAAMLLRSTVAPMSTYPDDASNSGEVALRVERIRAFLAKIGQPKGKTAIRKGAP